MEQMNIFECLYDTYKIKKPIRLIEFFAGIGSQAKALENLNANFEHWKICEWAIPSILAYNEIHQDYLKGYGVDYSKELTKEQLVEYLHNKGISNNYNEPMKIEQIKRQSEERLRSIYNAIISENNLVNIQQTQGKDLHIEETNKYDYILSYSFPCQDLSNAGLKKGMEKGSGTRSGLLWEVERILLECKEIGNLPNVLLLENVPEVIGSNNAEHFREWVLQLEKLGYQNYCQILNAKDYGIPQNRRRCFMISILGDYTYTMPKAIPLKLKLKDMLEDNVDEKYYLSDKQKVYAFDVNRVCDNTKRGDLGDRLVNPEVAKTISCRGAVDQRADITNFVIEDTDKIFTLDEVRTAIKENDMELLTANKSIKETIEGKDIENGDFLDFYNKNVIKSGVAGTITTRINASSTSGVVVADDFIPIPEATKKGYAEAHEGDSVNLEQQNSKTRRGRVGKQVAQTLLTGCQQGVVVSDKVNVVEIPQMVNKRKFEVNIEELKKTLRSHKKISNKEIAEKLNLPVTMVEHYFRNDSGFAIPDSEIWLQLKEILGIETTEFDESIMTFEEQEGVYEKANRVYHEEGIAPTLTCQSANEKILVSDRERYVGTYQFSKSDNFMQGRNRFQPNKECADTLQTSQKEGVVIISNTKQVENNIINEVEIKKPYSDYSMKKIQGNIIKGDIVGTITANAMQSVNHDNCHLYNNGLRIRKLTPTECYRLMGFEDIDKERASKVISDSMIYHTAGDSIVVNVLMAIFSQLL